MNKKYIYKKLLYIEKMTDIVNSLVTPELLENGNYKLILSPIQLNEVITGLKYLETRREGQRKYAQKKKEEKTKQLITEGKIPKRPYKQNILIITH